MAECDVCSTDGTECSDEFPTAENMPLISMHQQMKVVSG